MGSVNDAIKLHSSGFSCSGAVLGAYHEEAGLTSSEAASMARPMAGGKLVKCGAVLAAEAVIRQKFPEEIAAKKIEAFENEFISMNKSINCLELRGLGGGQKLRSCRGCVTDSCEILEKLL